MRPSSGAIRQIGNSQGIVIPKPLLRQLGLSSEVGAEAARKIAECGDDELVMGEFGNAGDRELTW